MRTIVDGRGCNTTPGPTGLYVEGDLLVGEINVVKILKELSVPKTVDSSGIDALRAVSDLSQKLSELEKGLKKSLTNIQEELDISRKDLKVSQEENKKLSERVKVLETELKKVNKTSKKDSVEATENT